MALIVKVGADIREFDREFKKLTKDTATVGKKMTSIGTGLTKGVTVPLLAIAGASAGLAIQFESDFAGVRKTVDATEEQFAELSQGIRDMAKEIPASTTEINAVAEAAGQLGIEVPNILGFTKTMVELGTATNLSSEEAASSLAKFANITNMSQKDFDKLGSVIVDLGNNFATTESEIVEMGMRLAGAGSQIGLSQAEIMGLSTALTSVGIEAEMGGSAFSKIMVNMQVAAKTGLTQLRDLEQTTGMTRRELELMQNLDGKGFKEMAAGMGKTTTELGNILKAGKNLESFGAIAGMTAEQFKQAFEKDAVGAIGSFVNGLGTAEEKGTSAIELLDEMGIREVRLRDSLLRAGNANELFTKSIDTANKAWGENTALTKEAETRFGTTASKLTLAKNRIKDVGIELGSNLIPAVSDMLKTAEPITNTLNRAAVGFSKMSDGGKKATLTIGAIAIATGPTLVGMGKLIDATGKVSAMFSLIGGAKAAKDITKVAKATSFIGPQALTATTSLAGLGSASATTGAATAGLATTFGAATLAAAPWILGIGAIGLAVYALKKSYDESQGTVKLWGAEVPKQTSGVLKGIQGLNATATGEFNLMAQGLNGSAKSMADDFSKIGQSVENDLKAKLEGLDKLVAGLPEAVRGAAQEIADHEKERISEHLTLIQENNKRVEELKKAANESEQGMTIEQGKRIRDLALQNAKEYLEVTVDSKADREKIYAAMTGDVENATQEQAEAWAIGLGKQRQKITSEYSKAREDLEKKLKEMGYALDSDVAKNMFKTLENGSKDATESIEQQLAKLAEKYPEIADKIWFANGQIVGSNQELAAGVKVSNQEMIDSVTTFAEETTNKLDLVADESSKAGKKWNGLVFDEKTGQVKSNVQEVVNEAAASTEGWRDLKYIVKNANLSSNAKMVVAEAAISSGQWWGLDWDEKSALLDSNTSKVVIKAMEDRGIWWDLDFKTQQALLHSDTPEKVQQALVDAGLWNKDILFDIKELYANNSDFMLKLGQSTEALNQYHGITPDLKTLLADNEDVVGKIIGSKELLQEYINLPPDLKRLIGENYDVNGKLIEAEANLNSFNGNNPSPKYLVGDNSNVVTTTTEANSVVSAYDANKPGNKHLSSTTNAPSTKGELDNLWGAWGKIADNSEKTFTTRHKSIFEKIVDGVTGKNAKGTDYFQGGFTEIHEKGDEVVNLPNGTQILTAGLSNQMMSQYGKNMANLSEARITRQVASTLSLQPANTASSIDLRRVEGLLQRLVAKEPIQFGVDMIGRMADNYQGSKFSIDGYQRR